MAAQLATWGLAFLTTVVMARSLGARGLGQIQLASSLWAIAAILVAFGNNVLLTKEVARTPERTGVLLSAALVMRTGLHGVAWALVTAYALWARYPPDTLVIIGVAGLVSLVGQYSTASRSALQGLERMEYISLADVVSKVISTAAILLVLLAGRGALAVVGVGLTLVLTSCAVQLYYLHRLQRLTLSLDWALIKDTLRAGWPYLLSGVVLVCYIEIDTLLIVRLVNETEVGWYGAAIRLLGTLAFIPSILMTAVFPSMARLQQQDRAALAEVLRRSAFWLMAVSIPLGLGTAILAGPLVVWLYGEAFAPTGPILAAFGLALVFNYQNILIGQYLIAIDRHNRWTSVMTLATLIKVGLNVVLVPWAASQWANGALGAAIGLLVTEMGMTVVGLALLPKGILGRATAGAWLRLLLAGVGMVASVAPLRHMFVLAPLAVGGLSYLLLLWVLRAVPDQDWQMVKALAKRLWLRLRRAAPAPSQAGG